MPTRFMSEADVNTKPLKLKLRVTTQTEGVR